MAISYQFPSLEALAVFIDAKGVQARQASKRAKTQRDQAMCLREAWAFKDAADIIRKTTLSPTGAIPVPETRELSGEEAAQVIALAHINQARGKS